MECKRVPDFTLQLPVPSMYLEMIENANISLKFLNQIRHYNFPNIQSAIVHRQQNNTHYVSSCSFWSIQYTWQMIIIERVTFYDCDYFQVMHGLDYCAHMDKYSHVNARVERMLDI